MTIAADLEQVFSLTGWFIFICMIYFTKYDGW